MKLLIPFIVLIIAATACKNNDYTSAYDELLSQTPYSSLTDSIKKEPGRDDLYFNRAVLLNKNDLPEPALADFKKAWSLSKREQYAYGISTILLQNKPDSAILFLQQAIRELPESYLLKLNLARSYQAQNKTDDALKMADDILKDHPQQLNTLLLKAELLQKKGHAAESVATLEKAYPLAPHDAEINHSLGFLYAQTKNPKTIAFCDTLIRKDSAGIHAEPYYFKGVYYANINDKDKALHFFNQAIQHDYNFFDAHMEKGQLLFEQKKIAEAARSFALVTTISPSYADAYYWTGRCHEVLGQKEEAKLNYQRAYGLDKTLIEAKEAAEKIID
jgi:tetratricopeptide (TPR) repeat protein